MTNGDRHVHSVKVHVHLSGETVVRLRQLLPEQESKQAQVCFLLTCAVEAAQCAKKRIVPKAVVPAGTLCPVRVPDEVYEFIKTYASEGGICMTSASTNLLFAGLEALEKAGVKEPASKEEVVLLLGGVPKSSPSKQEAPKLLARPRKKRLPSRKEDFLTGCKFVWRALWR